MGGPQIITVLLLLINVIKVFPFSKMVAFSLDMLLANNESMYFFLSSATTTKVY